MTNYGDSIHEAIHASLFDFVWSEVVMTNRPGTEAGFVRTTQPPDADLKPTGILIDQGNAAFQRDERHGRSLKTDRTDWIWDVALSFDRHVSFEEWETLLEDPILIPRTVSGQARDVILELQDSTYSSPVRTQSTSGSKAKLRFTATLSNL